jgi:predicted lipid carrier protein YhbT
MDSSEFFSAIKARMLVDASLANLLDKVISVTLRDCALDDAKGWLIDGKAKEVIPKRAGTQGGFSCDIEMDQQDFLEVIQNRLNPQALFREQRVIVTGDEPLEALKFFSLLD